MMKNELLEVRLIPKDQIVFEGECLTTSVGLESHWIENIQVFEKLLSDAEIWFRGSP